VTPDPSGLVSAIIPVYNGERYLAEAIESVLAQEHNSLELIVVDDGSRDGSAAIARRFPAVRYRYQPNGGIGAARNLGLQLARGRFIAFLDADDVWAPGKLAAQVQAFAADPRLDIVSGHVEQFRSPDLDEVTARRIRFPRELLPGYSFGAMLIKREAFLRVGPVSTVRTKAECVDWCLRATDLGLRVAMLPDVLLRRRLHDGNHSLEHRRSLGDYAHALKASLDRRRSATASRFQERGLVYVLHGVVERPGSGSLRDRNLLDRDAFARFVRKRSPRFGPLEQAIDGASSALTIDDATMAAFDAALLAREAGHEATVFINPVNVETGTPYWFSVLDIVLDGTSRPSWRVDGHDFSLADPGGRRQCHTVLKKRICALATEELRAAAVADVAEALGLRDPELPPALAPMTPAAVQELLAAGVRIENHGWTHRHPHSGPPEALWSDIARGQAWLRERLRVDSRAYAVPFGDVAPLPGMPSDLVDAWYLARPGPPGNAGPRVFNRRALGPQDILT